MEVEVEKTEMKFYTYLTYVLNFFGRKQKTPFVSPNHFPGADW